MKPVFTMLTCLQTHFEQRSLSIVRTQSIIFDGITSAEKTSLTCIRQFHSAMQDISRFQKSCQNVPVLLKCFAQTKARLALLLSQLDHIENTNSPLLDIQSEDKTIPTFDSVGLSGSRISEPEQVSGLNTQSIGALSVVLSEKGNKENLEKHQATTEISLPRDASSNHGSELDGKPLSNQEMGVGGGILTESQKENDPGEEGLNQAVLDRNFTGDVKQSLLDELSTSNSPMQTT
eukprot:TRINITY_DN11314_c0_g1_i5.p1 TRINITY_DN11314_c0_g1~~TRINITY_DN11314_c0_g1_i5.p1  ORF type:complete len:234 (-),score=32.53 TRINITY_DN11314_c0_g1_i5:431-1132(-)